MLQRLLVQLHISFSVLLCYNLVDMRAFCSNFKLLGYLVTYLATTRKGKGGFLEFIYSTWKKERLFLVKRRKMSDFFFGPLLTFCFPYWTVLIYFLFFHGRSLVFNERIWYCITFFRFRRPLQQHHFYKPYKTEGCKCKNRANWFPQSLSS